jgi:hypothetical protein
MLEVPNSNSFRCTVGALVRPVDGSSCFASFLAVLLWQRVAVLQSDALLSDMLKQNKPGLKVGYVVHAFRKNGSLTSPASRPSPMRPRWRIV